jgi:hypothetical protein
MYSVTAAMFVGNPAATTGKLIVSHLSAVLSGIVTVCENDQTQHIIKMKIVLDFLIIGSSVKKN